MVEKISSLETRIAGTINELKRLPDIKYQVEHRPWGTMFGSVLFGYIISRILFGGPRRRMAFTHSTDQRKSDWISLGVQSSFIGGMASSVVMILAREFAANLIKKWATSAPSDSVSGQTEEKR
jgi:hypothetical protein